MRVQSRLFLAAICVSVCAVAGANEIGLSPSSITVGEVETFLSIRGLGVRGSESTQIVFAGPGGQFVLEPSNDEPDLLISWIPVAVAVNAGTYSVDVYAKDAGQTPRHYGPAAFIVRNPDVVPLPPLLGVPEVVVADAKSPRGTPVFWQVNAMSQGGTGLVVACSQESGSLFPLGASIVSCTASDSAGSTTDAFFVVVADAGVPVLTVPNDIVSDVPNVNFTVTAFDSIDGEVPVVCSPSSGAFFPKGTTIVRCIAYDSSLNPGYGSFNVTVTSGAPLLQLPADIFTEATSSAGAVVTYSASSDGAAVSCSPASGATFPLGTTVVNCSATNAFGTTTGTFQVSVADTKGPLLTLPQGVIAEATSGAGAAVTYTATARDAVDGQVPVTCTPASGSTFPLGTTSVACTASDLKGIATSGSFSVSVRDTTPPQVVSITATPNAIWPPNHKMVPVQITVVATDAVSRNPTSAIVSVTSNQPEEGLGDGDTGPDWTILGPLNLELRAERVANVDRVYTINVETRDEAGNTTLSTLQVRVSQQSRTRSVR